MKQVIRIVADGFDGHGQYDFQHVFLCITRAHKCLQLRSRRIPTGYDHRPCEFGERTKLRVVNHFVVAHSLDGLARGFRYLVSNPAMRGDTIGAPIHARDNQKNQFLGGGERRFFPEELIAVQIGIEQCQHVGHARIHVRDATGCLACRFQDFPCAEIGCVYGDVWVQSRCTTGSTSGSNTSQLNGRTARPPGYRIGTAS
jgi:hypothetical protein